MSSHALCLECKALLLIHDESATTPICPTCRSAYVRLISVEAYKNEERLRAIEGRIDALEWINTLRVTLPRIEVSQAQVDFLNSGIRRFWRPNRTWTMHSIEKCGHCGLTNGGHTVGCPVIAPFFGLHGDGFYHFQADGIYRNGVKVSGSLSP